MTVTATYSDSSTASVPASSLNWSSSNATYANMDILGNVFATTSVGASTITGALGGSLTNTTSVSSAGPTYVTMNLRGYWDAALATLTIPATNPNTSWKDLTSNQYNGTTSSSTHATWVGSGIYSSPWALSLDGSGYVNFGASVMGSQTKMMFGAWINPGSVSSTDKIIFGNNRDGTGTGFTLRQSATASKIDYLIGNTVCTSASTFTNNTWNYLSGIYDGANATLYVDGKQDCTVAVSSSITPPTSNLISGATDANIKYWTGKISDLKLYGTSDGTAVGTAANVKTNFDVTADTLTGRTPWGNIVTSGLVLHLDAANDPRGISLFPGSGCSVTSWF